MRIHLPGNGLDEEKNSFLLDWVKAKTLGFPEECQGLHLLAHTQQESWPARELEDRRNNWPQLVCMHGFCSQLRQTPWPLVVLHLC